MADVSNERRATALDFATHSAVAGALTQEHPEEIEATLRELIAYFGEAAIIAAIASIGLKLKSDSHTNEVLRGYAMLIIDSDRQKLTARLVGKLVGLETSTGRRIILRELARAEGISKQAVSKRLATYAERLNLPRLESTEAARASHRLMNRRNYAANRRAPAATTAPA